jgi:acyl carrier protein
MAKELELDITALDSASSLEQLGVDSLSVIEFMFQLEDRFRICMSEEKVPVKTVQDIADLVDRLLAARDVELKPV